MAVCHHPPLRRDNEHERGYLPLDGVSSQGLPPSFYMKTKVAGRCIQGHVESYIEASITRPGDDLPVRPMSRQKEDTPDIYDLQSEVRPVSEGKLALAIAGEVVKYEERQMVTVIGPLG
ncbi:hypothetical protein N7492_004181 [Penicillium capsulatum]|uniref:Uncharacterized protein n=1 Tax=Penicillium capsulatum TaxID=69766 RepID=A0A9W9LWT6_9EURO|nr:hypothetical protein N7492_004181 [Penicillium capsulatum]